jgi:long-chain acyl-CoA synthetase
MAETRLNGVVIRYWKNAPPDLPTVLRASAAHGDRTFVVYEDERVSFAEHFARAAALAHRLRDDLGVRPGDRVAIAMRNLPEWPIAFFAITAAGAVAVPLNAWWSADELAYGLADSGARVLVADAERIERLEPRLPELPLQSIVAARPASLPGHPAGVLDFADLVAGARVDVELPGVDVSPDDHATLFYTSGTTGHPKGVVGSHRNICTNLWTVAFARARAMLRSGATREAIDALEPEPAFLLSVPLFHVTGCHSVLLSTIALGAKLVLMHRWDAELALELIERERITIFGGVPSMVWQVLESDSFERYDTSSVRSVRYGGAPAAAELVRRIDERLPGRTPSNGYGMTECSAIASSNAGADYRARPDSVGVPVPVCDVRIAAEDGTALPVGSVGELWLRGPNVARGYWNQPQATVEIFGGGWLRTGDLARVDSEGFLYIVDRAKDVVIRGGENVYCAQVEQALFEHPAVRDAAVIGVPHRVLGEEVGAVVVRGPGEALSEQQVREHVRERLAAYNVPAHVWLRNEPLPRNAAGKVLKAELKRALLVDPAP